MPAHRFPTKTIQHPGYEFFEQDLSWSKEYTNGKSGLFVGFASQGPVGVPTVITTEEEFFKIFGAPETEAEFYLYKGVYSALNAKVLGVNAYAIVLRLPYDNTLLNIKDGSFEQVYKCLKYSLKTDNSGLDDYKPLFEQAPSFKSFNVEPGYVKESELEALEDCDFVIYNKFNSRVKYGEELLVSVFGRSNALSSQGYISKAAPDIFNYEEFTASRNDLVCNKEYSWAYNVVDSINKNLLRFVPQIRTFLKQDETSGFYSKKVKQASDNDQDVIVVVSKTKRSTSEPGKYTIELLESFHGSLFKDAIDNLTKESIYVGDIINNNSAYIGYASKESFGRIFKRGTDELFVRDQTPYSISLKTEAELDKAILKNENKDIDYATAILEPILETVADYSKYTFTDIFECGLSSVVTYAAAEEEGGNLYFNPNKAEANETTDPEFLKADTWFSLVNKFSRYCKYRNQYCLSHCDIPRKLTLNGPLSRTDDIGQDENEVVITTAKIQALIKEQNCSYTELQFTWLEVVNPFLKQKQWVPATSLYPENIFKLVEPYEVPAGLNRGKVSYEVSRLSLDPNNETKDLLYKNSINYCALAGTREWTFEGQRTLLLNDLQINRIAVRRLANYLKRYVIGIGQKYIGEMNNVSTREKFKSDLEVEFERIKLSSGLEDYSIDVGVDINSDLVIAAGELRCKIIIKPVACIEFVLALFCIKNTGIQFEVERL